MAALVAAALAAIALTGCVRSSATAGRARVPPAPSLPIRSPGPNQPPELWVGGTLTDATADHLIVRERSGSLVTVQRLGEGATAFFRAASSSWERLDASAQIGAGQQACVDAVSAGSRLLALRVFLGADCGPV